MSFFTRAVVGLAIVAGIVHVFKKDLRKIARVLQKPAENFVADVRKELGDQPADGAVGAAPPPSALSGSDSSALNHPPLPPPHVLTGATPAPPAAPEKQSTDAGRKSEELR